LAERQKATFSLALWGIAAILLLLILYVGLYPQYYLSIKNLSNGKKILEVSTIPGDNLWIVFINSVEGLPVADHFIVNENHQIIFTETIYQAPYAGYVNEEMGKNIAPRTTRISDFEKPMEKVTFYAGYTSRHMIFLNGHWVPIYDIAKGGDLVQIQIIRRSRLVSYLERIESHD
jgi:hypothetical protein